MKGHTYKRCACGALRDDAGRRVNCGKRHGSWFYVHALPANATGSRRQATKGGFSTEREARKALNDSLSQLDRGTYVEPTKQAVGEYLDQWLDGKGRLRASTRRSYREHIDLYLRPGLGHLRLSDLREVDIERLYCAMGQLGAADPQASHELERLLRARNATPLRRPLTAARIRRVHATLMSALGSAVKRKVISHNPAAHVELANGRRPKAVVCTDDQVATWRRTGAPGGGGLDRAAGRRVPRRRCRAPALPDVSPRRLPRPAPR